MRRTATSPNDVKSFDWRKIQWTAQTETFLRVLLTGTFAHCYRPIAAESSLSDDTQSASLSDKSRSVVRLITALNEGSSLNKAYCDCYHKTNINARNTHCLFLPWRKRILASDRCKTFISCPRQHSCSYQEVRQFWLRPSGCRGTAVPPKSNAGRGMDNYHKIRNLKR